MHATATPAPLTRIRTYASFVRFEHTLFSLPLILAGVFSAPGPPLSWTRWLLIALAAVGARTAAMAINRLVDRRMDAHNPRTQSRELPAGRMRLIEAWGLLCGSVLVYAIACALLGRWFLGIAVVPLAVFVIYPYLKRITPFCHFGVGVALALAPLAGYAAAHPDLAHPEPALWLGAFALAWVSGFDIIYATLDERFDREHAVHSAVVRFGRDNALRLSSALHVFATVFLVAAASTILMDHPSVLAFALTAVTLVATTVLLFLEQRWAENVNLAFFKVNVWVGACVLLTILAARIHV
jgi:4-hydroxybenzoate polyprenyltransferase